MASCHEMKKDEIYECKACGLQVRVVAECKQAGKPSADHECHEGDARGCHISCCGEDLVKKS